MLPQSWEDSSYYPVDGLDGARRVQRNRLLQTFGNLTLPIQPLNSSVSNGPFRDYELNGKTVGGKRSGFIGSLLLLNSYFLSSTLTTWSDEQIMQREDRLLQSALSVWPRPGPEP